MENKEDTPPPLKCGYCGWLIGGLLNTSLLNHKCFQFVDENTHFLHINDCNIATIVEKDQSLPATNQNNLEDYNERLIAAVQAKPALYDHRIPVKERTSLKKKDLWKEVLNVLGEPESNLELVQKRWKQLRDSCVKAKRKETEYIPSGSAASSSKMSQIQFSLYNQMKFLDDVTGKSSTVTSLPDKTTVDDIVDIESRSEDPFQVTLPQTSNSSIVSEQSWTGSDSLPSPNHGQQQKTKRLKTCDDISDVKIAILSALEGGSARKPDAVDGFLLQIGDRLRALPLRERSQFEIKVLSLLFELEQDLSPP